MDDRPECNAAAASVRSAARRGRVMVVDDDPVVCQVVERMLLRFHDVDIFQSSKQALEKFAVGSYDLALIDLGMPEMPGHLLSTALREIDAVLSTVLITGWDLADADPRCHAFDFQIVKPIEMDILLDVVTRALDLRDQRGRAN